MKGIISTIITLITLGAVIFLTFFSHNNNEKGKEQETDGFIAFPLHDLHDVKEIIRIPFSGEKLQFLLFYRGQRMALHPANQRSQDFLKFTEEERHPSGKYYGRAIEFVARPSLPATPKEMFQSGLEQAGKSEQDASLHKVDDFSTFDTDKVIFNDANSNPSFAILKIKTAAIDAFPILMEKKGDQNQVGLLFINSDNSEIWQIDEGKMSSYTLTPKESMELMMYIETIVRIR